MNDAHIGRLEIEKRGADGFPRREEADGGVLAPGGRERHQHFERQMSILATVWTCDHQSPSERPYEVCFHPCTKPGVRDARDGSILDRRSTSEVCNGTKAPLSTCPKTRRAVSR